MKVNWRINLIFGIIAFVLTYGFSIVNNTWLPSLFRAVIGLLLFAALGYLLQFVLRFIASMKDQGLIPKQEVEVESLSEPKIGKAAEEDFTDQALFQSIPLEALQKDKSVK